jgi:hypothetical protein
VNRGKIKVPCSQLRDRAEFRERLLRLVPPNQDFAHFALFFFVFFIFYLLSISNIFSAWRLRGSFMT